MAELLQRRVTGKAHAAGAGDAVQRLAVVTGIDLKTIATANLYTVPDGRTAIIVTTDVEITAASEIVTPATAGVGIAAGEDDIVASVLMAALLAAGDVYRLAPTGKFRIAPAGAIIKFGVDGGAVGTSQTATVHLMGYLI